MPPPHSDHLLIASVENISKAISPFHTLCSSSLEEAGSLVNENGAEDEYVEAAGKHFKLQGKIAAFI